MPTFTDYHQFYVQSWRNLLFERAKWDPTDPRVVVEIGSFEGSSAWWLMTNLLLSPESRLYCIDLWPGEVGEAHYRQFKANIAELPNREQVTYVRGYSHHALMELHRRGVKADLLYVDGGHEATTVLRDLVLGFEIVKPGGIIICDDYIFEDKTYPGDKILGRPKIAIDAFTTIYSEKLRIIRGIPLLQMALYKDRD